MNRQRAIQVFTVLAVCVGLVVSYNPPKNNAEAIWALVGLFVGHAMRDLFGEDKLRDPKP